MAEVVGSIPIGSTTPIWTPVGDRAYGEPVEAQAWALFGLFGATLFGTFFYLGNRIVPLREHVDARLDNLNDRLESRADIVKNRIDGVGSRMDAFGARLDAFVDRVSLLEGRIEDQRRSLGSAISEVAAKIDGHLRRHES